MKKLTKRLLISAAAIMMASPAFIGSTTVSADKVSEAKSAVASKTSSNNALLAKISAQQNSVAKLNNAVGDKTTEVAAKTKEISTTEARITAISGEITTTQTELVNRKSVLRKQLIELQSQSTNSTTGNVYIDFVLSSDSFSDLVSRSLTVNKLNDANQEAMDAVTASEKKLSNLKTEQVDKKAQLVADKTSLVAEQASLTTQKKAAEAAEKSLEKELEDNKVELAALQGSLTSAQAAAQAAVAKVTATAATTKTAAKKTPSQSTTNVNVNVNISGTGVGASIASIAATQLGRPYVYGGSSPAGFDCSGLIQYAASRVGVSLPHSAAAQGRLGSAVSLSNLRVGDLLFWGGSSSAYHVAVYIGNNTYIHAPKPGDHVKTATIGGSFTPSFARRL